jgi:hypothetical protein
LSDCAILSYNLVLVSATLAAMAIRPTRSETLTESRANPIPKKQYKKVKFDAVILRICKGKDSQQPWVKLPSALFNKYACSAKESAFGWAVYFVSTCASFDSRKPSIQTPFMHDLMCEPSVCKTHGPNCPNGSTDKPTVAAYLKSLGEWTTKIRPLGARQRCDASGDGSSDDDVDDNDEHDDTFSGEDSDLEDVGTSDAMVLHLCGTKLLGTMTASDYISKYLLANSTAVDPHEEYQVVDPRLDFDADGFIAASKSRH